MLAEIHNKISQSGSNLSDRLEDKLTGDFFGALRYLPFELGMKNLLEQVEFSENEPKDFWRAILNRYTGFPAVWNFWPRDIEGEIDLLLSFEDLMVGIEVKYLSGISSEDEMDTGAVDHTVSVHQLARYARMLERVSEGRPVYLIFLAPFAMMKEVRESMENRSIIAPGVKFGFLNWEDIHESLTRMDLDPLNQGQQLIIEDLRNLLLKKGLKRFRGLLYTKADIIVSKDHYTFHIERNVSTQKDWSWPAEHVEKEKNYVYKIKS
ncbi:hypothetical protein [Jeotgalibacillus sp. R-1-5s-1]|uniref:hypothetical protein n=1 Tax=Jeotgalibacillus sp. R-1-5s-1 TaxID=2555897 RepID=UPI001ABC1C24|nr:hypothetical protein [Jeotgalibacillus sp. R-1-5s-1]